MLAREGLKEGADERKEREEIENEEEAGMEAGGSTCVRDPKCRS